jgi:hypothetical protein
VFKNPIQDIKTSHFISLCILRDRPQQKIPRELCGGEILLYFYIPMFPCNEFLMGWNRKIQKHTKETDRSGKFKRTRSKE